jgi:RNA 3'-terminal phosphate cyclase (ATP)
MIHIDGSAKSGSGTIVRCSVALASLLGEELHITNIRARRDKPGLRPQHLASVKACADMCGAQMTGAVMDSMELVYKPRHNLKGGHYQWDIGTAGSTTLLVMSLLPMAIFAEEETILRVSGGLFQDFAPSAHHMQYVLLPTLAKMGISATVKIIRPGYVPRGGGIIQVDIKTVAKEIKPLVRLEQGKVTSIHGIALSSHLKEARVSQRMADECQKSLAKKGSRAQIETMWDESSLQAGASLAIWVETDSGCLLGADQTGARGRSSESIGRYVAQTLLEDLATGATVDRYLSDQMIIYGTLASGTTEYRIPRFTEHVDANLWLVEQFGAHTRVDGNTIHIKGIGYTRKRAAPG